MQFDADYANIKDGIMSILFESYDSILLEGKLDDYIADNKLTKEQALSGETFKAIKALIKQGDEKTKDAIEKAFAKIEAAETASDEQTSNEEISDDKKVEISDEEKTSTEEDKEKETSVEANENPSENGDIRADLYIIPMPGLKYKDKEYDTNA